MNGLLVGEDKAVADWVFQAYSIFPMTVDCALGIVTSTGELVGGVLFQNYNGNNIELSYYGNKTMSPGIVRTLAKILTKKYNVSRCTVTTSKRNRRLMRSLIRMGFKFEGTQRCFYGQKDNARNTGARFVMFRDRLDVLAAVSQSKKAGVA